MISLIKTVLISSKSSRRGRCMAQWAVSAWDAHIPFPSAWITYWLILLAVQFPGISPLCPWEAAVIVHIQPHHRKPRLISRHLDLAWHCPVPALAVASVWRVTQYGQPQLLPLCLSAFQINTIFFLKKCIDVKGKCYKKDNRWIYKFACAPNKIVLNSMLFFKRFIYL